MMNKEREEFWKKMEEFDDAAAKAGGYVEYVPNRPQFRIRDAYEKVKKIGRPLTDEEMKEFEIKLENRKETSK